MLTLRKVAVTGSLSSGKTTVCRFFAEFGAYVVSADEIVHQYLSLDTNLGRQVVKLLGQEIVVGSTIDRAKIAQKVFIDRKLLEELEKLIHPVVLKELELLYQQALNSSKKLFVAEIPLLYEAGMEIWFDKVIVVEADSNECKKRFTKIAGHSEKDFDIRMKRQLDIHSKVAKSHYVLSNHGSIQELKDKTYKLYLELLN